MRHASGAVVWKRMTQLLLVALAVAYGPLARADGLHRPDATELRLQVDGSLLGQVLAYDENLELRPVQVRVSFAKGPDVAASAYTDAEGMFRITGLAPGSYAVFTTGPKGFAAFAIRVLPADVPVIGGAAMQGEQPAPNGEHLTFGPAPASSYRLFVSLLKEDMPQRRTMVNAKPGVKGAEVTTAVGETRSAPAAKATSAKVALAADYDVTHAHLRIDGNLIGRVMNVNNGEILPEVTQVSFAQNGQYVASVRSDEWGYFQVVGLRPGIYSVMTVSARGFSVLALRVMPFESKEGPQQQTLLQLPGTSAARVHLVSSSTATVNVLGYSPASSEDYEAFSSFTEGVYGGPGAGAGVANAGVTTGESAAAGMMGGGGGGMGGLGGLLGAGLGLGIGLGGGGDEGVPGAASTPDSP